MRHTIYAILIAMAIVATASADSLKPAQIKAKTESEKSMSSDIADLNKTCGTSIEVSLDVSTYGDDWTKWIPEKPGQICGHALYGIKTLCRDAAYKPAVADKIKKVTCSTDGTTDPVEKNISLSGGVLHLKMNIKHDNRASLDTQHWVAKELNK
jgi:hypothetical protein